LLKNQPRLQALRKELLKTALENFDKVAENQDVQISKANIGKAATLVRMGDLCQEIGETKKALDLYEQSCDVFKTLATKSPADDRIRFNQAVVLIRIGPVRLRLYGDKSQAKKCYLEALALLKKIDQQPQDGKLPPQAVKSTLVDALQRLGAVTIDNDPAEALKYYDEVLQQRLVLVDLLPNKAEAEQTLASAYLMVGGAHLWLHEESAANQNNQEALKILRRLNNDHSENLDFQQSLAFALQRQGDLELRTGRPTSAQKLYKHALDIYQTLIERDKEKVRFQEDAARAQYDVATAALSDGDRPTAEKMYAESKAIRQGRAKAEPDNISNKKDLMITLARCGDHAEAARIAKQISDLPEDGGSLVEVAGCYALCALALDSASLSPNDQKLRTEYAEWALQALRKAAEQGYRNVVNLETEPDLKFIQNDEKFKAIIQGMKQKKASLQVDAK
jgi:tetratricopeptide (TPR) repeat protein